eukprot:COSAG01_NODE_8266_length_2851_cov_9.645349_1_plen_110_part_00
MNDRSDASVDRSDAVHRWTAPLAHTSHRDAQGAQRVDPIVWGITRPQDRSRPAGPVWAHVPHRVGRLLMPLPRRRMGLSSDEERALSEGSWATAQLQRYRTTRSSTSTM